MLTLGPLGQMQSVCTYTIVTLGFPVKGEPNEEYIISTLRKAANQIVQAYPWVSGQVVVEKSTDDKTSGKFKIIEYKAHEGKDKFLHVKDCAELCPSFEDIVKARAPASMLDGSIICPVYGFANFYPDDVLMPVSIIQANFIKGGLLLTVGTHHCAMDANGNEQFIRQFAALCRGEKLLEDDILIGNSDQNTIIPPLKPGQELHSLDNFRCPSSLGAPAGSWPPAPPTHGWRTFRFPQAKIAALKSQASILCSKDSDVKYISSNDAVTAFIWSRVLAVRSVSLPKESSSNLIRAVDGRRRLDTPISHAYMGHSILCCYTNLPVSEITDLSLLSATAIAVRRSLLEVDDRQVRSFFHLLQNEKDKTTFAYGAKMKPETDMMVTSFVGQKLYYTSFGEALGLPSFVRRPNLPDAQGLLYMMPITREGDIDLVAGVSEEELKGLLKDEEWSKYTEFIG